MSRASVTYRFKCSPQSCSTRHSGVRLAALIVSVFSFIPISVAQQARPTEYQVKAAYLYNFGKFVDWSSVAVKDNSFTICVLGRDPFGLALDATSAKQTIYGRSVVVRRLTKPQEALNCQILFISSSENADLKEVLATLDR